MINTLNEACRLRFCVVGAAFMSGDGSCLKSDLFMVEQGGGWGAWSRDVNGGVWDDASDGFCGVAWKDVSGGACNAIN